MPLENQYKGSSSKSKEHLAGTDNKVWQALIGTEGSDYNSSNGSIILGGRDRT